jgi:hypothetical protein
MNRFAIRDRDESMTHVVSYLRVPVPRGVAFTLYHVAKHGGHIDLFSCVRTVPVVASHNKSFGTHLHSQAYLYANQNRPGFNPANPPSTSSHCWKSDGNSAYKVNGKQIPAKSELPWYMVGIDLADAGEYESVDDFLRVARGLGYEMRQPYPVGGERHHVCLIESPISVLERYNVISKRRG